MGTETIKGRSASRTRPFVVAVNAVVSVVLFDQNLDQKIDLGWPGSSPGLAQVKPWAGPGSSPGKTGPENLAISQTHIFTWFFIWLRAVFPGHADHVLKAHV